MDDIRILRLQTGEDVIAKYREDDITATIIMTDPMTLMFKRLASGKSIMMLSPWLPLELIESNKATIFVGDVITNFKPKKSFITYYKKLVNETNIDLLETSKQIEESLLNPIDENDLFDDNDDNEEYLEEDIEDYLYSNIPNKNTIH